MAVTIASELLREIMTAAQRCSDREVCGLLLGDGATIRAVQPCRNVAAEPATRFEIDPAALIAAHRTHRCGGPAVIGHYHSHPTGDPTPSARDAADAAIDGALWLIVGGGRARLWRATANGALHRRFDAVGLHVTPATVT